MYLVYLVKPEMLTEDVLRLSYYRKKLQNLSDLNCGLQIRQIWIQLITTCGKYCKRRCTKQASLIWSYRWRNWRMRHDPAWPTPFSVAVSVCSDQWCAFCTYFLPTGFKSGKFGGYRWDGL